MSKFLNLERYVENKDKINEFLNIFKEIFLRNYNWENTTNVKIEDIEDITISNYKNPSLCVVNFETFMINLYNFYSINYKDYLAEKDALVLEHYKENKESKKNSKNIVI